MINTVTASLSAHLAAAPAAVPADGGGVFGAWDSLTGDAVSSIQGAAPLAGVAAAVATLLATGMKITVLRCVLAVVVGSLAFVAVNNWDLATSLFQDTFSNLGS